MAVNDLGPIDANIHLLKYDSIHGVFDKEFNVIDNKLTFEDNEILFLKESNPEKLNWSELILIWLLNVQGYLQKERMLKTFKFWGKKSINFCSSNKP